MRKRARTYRAGVDICRMGVGRVATTGPQRATTGMQCAMTGMQCATTSRQLATTGTTGRR